MLPARWWLLCLAFKAGGDRSGTSCGSAPVGISEALALEQDMMTVRVLQRYCLGQHIPHPDHGDTGQSPDVGPRELNPLSVHFWVIWKMCLS